MKICSDCGEQYWDEHDCLRHEWGNLRFFETRYIKQLRARIEQLEKEKAQLEKTLKVLKEEPEVEPHWSNGI